MAPDAHAQATLASGAPSAPDGERARPMTLMRTARASWEPAEADPPLQPGAVVDGRYRVVGLVGEGGMGRVYETEHLFLRRRLALKLVRRDAGTGEAAARLLQEAVLAGKVPHATVVPVFDCAALPDGQVYVAMELLRGESLEAALLRPLPAAAGLRWLADVARGLAAAHRAGIVHRDVKPANVFLAQTGEGAVQPRILDFGIAKLLPGLSGEAAAGVQTQAGALLGTPFYMAPERARGEIGDGRADLYSFGVILYEALTGQVPFVGEGFMEIVGRHLREPPLDPRQAAPGRQIPDALAELTLQLLRKDPAARPGDGDAVADALVGVCAREPDAVASLTLGADGGGAGAPAGAPTQAIVEASTQRLDGSLVSGAAAVVDDGVTDMSVRESLKGHVEEDMSVNASGQVATGMAASSTAARGGRGRALGVVAACAAAGALIAWAALARIDAGPGAASERPPEGAPGPAEPDRLAAAAADTGEPGSKSADTGEPGSKSADTGEPGSGSAESTSPSAAVPGPPEPAAGAQAEPEPDAGEAGEAATKKRGKKAPRKAGTTGPGPGSGPKIKTDVYDE